MKKIKRFKTLYKWRSEIKVLTQAINTLSDFPYDSIFADFSRPMLERMDEILSTIESKYDIRQWKSNRHNNSSKGVCNDQR